MSKLLKYAGVGSRKTPAQVLKSMELIGEQLSGRWLLRSGYAPGADLAFGRGAESKGGSFEMFLPWEGFNSAPLNDDRFIVPSWNPALLQLAAESYDADSEVVAGNKASWRQLKDTTKLLMARNVCQVLGRNADDPVDMVICWTPGGLGKGGTGQAIRLARMFSIPCFDIATPEGRETVCSYTEIMENPS